MDTFGLDDEMILETVMGHTDMWVLAEGTFMDKYNRKSLTNDESAQLKVPKKNLHCSVMRFEDKKGKLVGYAAYTHRAVSKFYPSPSAIPAEKLEFISSTA